MGLADWAIRRTIRIHLNRVPRAYRSGALNSAAVIADDVLNQLASIYVSDNRILREELGRYFGNEEIADAFYDRVGEIATQIYGTSAMIARFSSR